MPLPTPRTGEDKNNFVSRCMSNDTAKKEFPDQKRRTAVCFSQWRKKDGGKAPDKKENVKLSYSSPIKISETLNASEDKDSIKIKGVMLKASTSRNGRTYTIEEINKAKFSGDNISVDHTESTTDNVGTFKPILTTDGLDFEGVVHNTPYHPGIVEMIRKGLTKFVSIEAIAQEVVKEGDQFLAKGLDFTGLGLVKTPGFAEASFAIAEAFKENDNKGDEMTEEKTNIEEPTKEEETEKPKETEEAFQERVTKVLNKIEEDNKKRIETEKKESKIEETFKKLESLETEIKKLKEKPSRGIITETPGENVIEFVRKKDSKSGTIIFYPKFPEKCY